MDKTPDERAREWLDRMLAVPADPVPPEPDDDERDPCGVCGSRTCIDPAHYPTIKIWVEGFWDGGPDDGGT